MRLGTSTTWLFSFHLDFDSAVRYFGAAFTRAPAHITGDAHLLLWIVKLEEEHFLTTTVWWPSALHYGFPFCSKFSVPGSQSLSLKPQALIGNSYP